MTTLQSHTDFLQSILHRQKRRRLIIDPAHPFHAQVELSVPESRLDTSLPGPSKDNVINYIPGEETVRNDYTAWYNSSGISGADYMLGAKDSEICEEYPALRRLMNLKAEQINQHSHPPLYLPLPNASSATISSGVGPHRFDVILIHPSGTWDETAALPVRNISADPGFVFLWVGRGDQDGLERGRECLARWGFRRAEDIVWVKPTKSHRSEMTSSGQERKSGAGAGGLLASQKEHCLMGIRGTVRRSTDGHFAHCNVDTDVMVWSGDGGDGNPDFPPYLYTLIESFCLGTRRLQLSPRTNIAPRRGWVTASTLSPPMNTPFFDTNTYSFMLPEKSDGRDVLPFDGEIDHLRPKSPVRNNRRNQPSQPPTSTGGPSRPPRGPPRQSYTPNVQQPTGTPMFAQNLQPQMYYPPRMSPHPSQPDNRRYQPSADPMTYSQYAPPHGYGAQSHRSPVYPATSPSFAGVDPRGLANYGIGSPASGYPASMYDPQMLYMTNQMQQTHISSQFYHPETISQASYGDGGGHVENGVWYPPTTARNSVSDQGQQAYYR